MCVCVGLCGCVNVLVCVCVGVCLLVCVGVCTPTGKKMANKNAPMLDHINKF